MKPGKVRAIAICVFEHDGKLLVGEGHDEIRQQTFGRPLGGTIEFGEYSSQTIVREIHEELGAEITSLRFLGTIENVFNYNGEIGHEIVLVYRGELVDQGLYNCSRIEGIENGDPIHAVWMLLADFQSGKIPLYPTGLLELITCQALEALSHHEYRPGLSGLPNESDP
jgi:8-oxo-dGTP pyrophosphatase MutT (NUDIX family)